MEILKVQNLTKTYGKGDTMVKALDNVSFSVPKGQFVASSVRPVRENLHFFIFSAVLIRQQAVMFLLRIPIFQSLMKQSLPFSAEDI